jgi:hypothetical protein
MNDNNNQPTNPDQPQSSPFQPDVQNPNPNPGFNPGLDSNPNSNPATSGTNPVSLNQPSQTNQTPQFNPPPPPPQTQPSVQPQMNTPAPMQDPNQSILNPESTVKNSKSPKKAIFIILLLLVLVALGIGGYFYISNQNANLAELENEITTPLTTPMPTVTPEVVSEVAECAEFAQMLETCTPYTCQFTHPLTGTLLTREIVGIEDGTCVYNEQMPENQVLSCNYSLEVRVAVANYYRDIMSTETVGEDTETSGFGSELGAPKSYTIDGVEVNDPNQEALDRGECSVVSS